MSRRYLGWLEKTLIEWYHKEREYIGWGMKGTWDEGIIIEEGNEQNERDWLWSKQCKEPSDKWDKEGWWERYSCCCKTKRPVKRGAAILVPEIPLQVKEVVKQGIWKPWIINSGRKRWIEWER